MAKQTQTETTGEDLDVGQLYTKSELFFEKNRTVILIGAVALLVGVGGFFGYRKLVAEPNAKQAHDLMWKAQYYFEMDSLQKAIDGDGNYYGFAHIADKYGSTPAGQLSKFYLGVCYHELGDHEAALSYYRAAGPDDDLLSVMTVGNQGDVLVELDRPDEAIQSFMKAADMRKSDYTTPLFLLKAGVLYRQKGDWSNAAKVYKRVIKEYPGHPDVSAARKFAAEAEGKGGKA